MSLSEYEKEVLALEALVEQRQQELRRKNRKSKAAPTQLEEAFNSAAEELVSQGDPIELLSGLLDRQLNLLDHMETHNGPDEPYTGPNYYANLCTQKGRIQGLAAALAVLRSSTVRKETFKSMERVGDNEH